MKTYNLNKLTIEKLNLQQGDQLVFYFEENPPIGTCFRYSCTPPAALSII